MPKVRWTSPEQLRSWGRLTGATITPESSSGAENIVRDHYVHLIELHKQHEQFAKLWDNNLRLQGFAEAFKQQQTPRA